MSYATTFQTLANRSLALAEVDLETFIENSINSGMSPAALQQELLHDLTTEGPLFGKFVRNITGASQASTLQAHRQGTRAGEMVGSPDKELRDLLEFEKLDIEAILDSGDPSELERLDAISAPLVSLMWVAELVNTCHLCLPLHGVVLTGDKWRDRGLNPDTIHGNAGFNSPCYCHLVDVENIDRDEKMAPLKRTPQKSPTGLKLGRRTVRSVTQQDVDKSQAARDKAMNSIEGRRTLRRAGMVKG